jgi:hypothetical protein
MLGNTLCQTMAAGAFFGLQAINAQPLDLDINLDLLKIVDLDVEVTIGVAGEPATYDYVVVGGGTAGLAMAARLSESYSVAVIEAGTYYSSINNESTVPEYVVDFLSTTLDESTWAATDWGFTTTNQTALGGSQYHYSRAKTLGGW